MFVIAVAVLVVVAEHFASGSYPPQTSNCGARGITTDLRRQGSCEYGNSKLVVVDEATVLKLASLEAKLEGIRERKTINGPTGPKNANGEFLTFDLALTNRTDEPAEYAAGQAVLVLGQPVYGEDVEIDERYEPRSFLAHGRAIPPGGTESGTVTFAVPASGAAALGREGNLDLENFGTNSDPLDPEVIFSAFEHGVIRTYQ
jgi:hypothetical protein